MKKVEFNTKGAKIIVFSMGDMAKYIPELEKYRMVDISEESIMNIYKLVYIWLDEIQKDFSFLNIHIVQNSGTFFIFKIKY